LIVVDTNVLVAATIAAEPADDVAALLRMGESWVAPPLWRSEFRNALAGYLRRGSLSEGNALAIYDEARALVSFEFDPESDSVLALVGRSVITAYDAEFVALAQLLSAPLVTFDRQVLRAFPEVAITPQAFAASN
jgi:predicted nucleic acid-binding protein